MAAIPAKLFHTVEWHLHHESELVESAVQRREEVIASVLDGCGLKTDGMPRGKGGHGEPTAQKAMKLLKAGEDVEQARAWARVIRETYDYFDDTPVFRMAAAYYGRGVTLRALAGQLCISEDSLNKQRDKFVSTCAVFAAAGGLVGVDGRDGTGSEAETVSRST